MYLKRIEIQGFKSFANKIRLDFHNGFTAIVGPNGSGKSNIADAVRWVLGEQRVRALRGGSMQDVIFAGTELRKPLSFAYVAITFDNTDHILPVDYEEVTVARRLYRSGESEYLLNRAQVRLRDVQELFYDTGIGREGYSIIGQGQIERILSDRPEDRRELFDEAAGIVKFKRRKETSLKKLDSEKANLVRVNDILSELEKQTGPLERQAQKAQEYLRIRDELRILDVNLFLLQNEEAAANLAELTARLSGAQSQLEDTVQQEETSRRAYDEIRGEIAQLEQQIEKTRDEIAHANTVRSQLETQIEVGEETIRSLSVSAAHFRERETSVRAQLEEKEKEIASLERSSAASADAVRRAQESCRAEEESLKEIQVKEAGLQEQQESLRSQLMDSVSRRGSVHASLAALKERRRQLESRQGELKERLRQAATDEAQSGQDLERLTRNFEEIAGEIRGLQERQNRTEEQIDACKHRLASADEHLRASETEYHQERSRMEALVNLTERYEGFGGSVKRVMEERGHEPGLIGVVADLIKTEPRYETAIETALGGSIQNIVTDNEDTARRMIGILKREKAGRATFLPLNAIRGGQGFAMMGALKEPGAIGLADTLVRTAPEHRDVAGSLLGRTLVVDDYDHAVAISRGYQHRIRIVTLSGELFMPGGSVSGGAFRGSSSLLGRRREIAELKRRTSRLKEETEKAQASIAATKEERNHLRAELGTVREQLQEAFLRQNTARVSLADLEERRRSGEEGLDALRKEQESLDEDERQLRPQEESLRGELTESERFEEESNLRIAELTQELTSLRGKEEEQSSIVRGWELEVHKKRQELAYTRQELDRAGAGQSRLQEELKEMQDSLRAGEDAIEAKRQELASLREETARSGTARDEKSLLLQQSQEQRTLLTKRQETTLEERDRLAGDRSRLDREVYRLQEQKKKAAEAMDSRINYLWDEYEITPSGAEALRDETMTQAGPLKTRADGLRGQIRALGNVNVGAIEEYQAVKERYTFLKGQRDDLVAAQEALEKIIRELDGKMRRQFREQFSRMQSEFDRVFRELFGGGHGRLELMEGEDLLTAGVRVTGQPPGKKLQNMMQMSGGEKALTAIALLFSIQNLRPSPFCLLDEIEAALDESNVARFADYLRRLSGNTQFVVITHRRGTMERADRLYGVTMQEKGVSALVSVDLISEDELAS